MKKTFLSLAIISSFFAEGSLASQAQDNNCKEYVKTFQIGSKIHKEYGEACLGSSGEWVIQDEQLDYNNEISNQQNPVIYKEYYKPSINIGFSNLHPRGNHSYSRRGHRNEVYTFFSYGAFNNYNSFNRYYYEPIRYKSYDRFSDRRRFNKRNHKYNHHH